MRFKIDLTDYLQTETALFTTLLLVMIASVTLVSIPLQAVFIVFCLGMFVVYHQDVNYIHPNDKNYLIFLLLVTGLILPINVFRTATSALHFIMVISTLAGALIVAKNPRAYTVASLMALLIAQTAVLAFLFLRGFGNEPLDEMIEGTSSNGITSIIICLQVNYCIINLHIRGRAALLTSALTFFICIIGYGRGSILAATAIMLISLVFAFRRLPRLYAIGATVLLVLGVGVFIEENYQAIYDFAQNNTKLGSGLYDEPRAVMLEEYLSRTVGINILIGSSFDNTMIDRFFNGNPHNAYIRGHHFLGLFYIFAMTLMALRPLFARISVAEKGFQLAMLTVLILRATTEPILFPTPFDLMYFAIFLLFGRSQLQDRAGGIAYPRSTRS